MGITKRFLDREFLLTIGRMLDKAHPQSQHIFAAARLEDFILDKAKVIIGAKAEKRQGLISQCEETFASLRTLNSERFGSSQSIFESIDELQQAVHRLGEIDTPSLGIIMPALTRLRSTDGFGTECI